MKEIIEIKRKEFEVIEQIGERTFKVERKGNYYFLKKWEGDVKGFELFEKNQLVLRNSGIKIPKVYMWDKKSMISVVDYVEGQTVFDILAKESLDEKIIEQVFIMLWYSRKATIYLDFDPRNFIFSNGNIIYTPFRYSKFVKPEEFLDKDYRLWMFTKEFVRFAHDLGIDVDQSRLKPDPHINKEMTLLAVKYYK